MQWNTIVYYKFAGITHKMQKEKKKKKKKKLTKNYYLYY